MKRNYINNISLTLLVWGLAGCWQGQDSKPAHTGHEQVMDSSLEKLVKPANEFVVASLPEIRAVNGPRIFTTTVPGMVDFDERHKLSISSRVGGRIEKIYVRFNFQEIRKNQLIMEIYSPELVAAQRELIYLQRSGSDQALFNAARQKLLLLGMSASQINRVLKQGNPEYKIGVYSPADGYIRENLPIAPSSPVMSTQAESGGMDGMGTASEGSSQVRTGNAAAPVTTPVLIREGQYINPGQSVFSVYQDKGQVAKFSFTADMSQFISKGKKILVWAAADTVTSTAMKIGLVEPVVANGKSFLEARVYLDGKKIRPGQLVTGMLAFTVPQGWWLPKEALWDLGDQQLIFTKEEGSYSPRRVRTGIRSNGWVQVLDDIGNLRIASNAWFLVDSESFIPANLND